LIKPTKYLWMELAIKSAIKSLMTTPNVQNRCGCTSNNFVLQFFICFFASNMEQHGDHSGSVFGFLLCSCSLVVFVSQNFKLFPSFITLKVFIAFWCAFLIIKKFAYKFFAGGSFDSFYLSRVV